MERKRPLQDIIEGLKRTGIRYPYTNFAFEDCKEEDKETLKTEINRLKIMGYCYGPQTEEAYLEDVKQLFIAARRSKPRLHTYIIKNKNNGSTI